MDNADYNGGELIAVSIAFLALTYISVILRCFVRLRITKSFSLDDWLMLVAQINFTVSCAFLLRGVHYGIGHHNLAVPQNSRIQALKYQALATLTYVPNMMFIKLSLGVFLLRIAVKQRYIWILKISMVIITIWSTAIFLYSIFECQPVEAQWDFTIQPQKCTSGDSFVAAAYSISVLSIVSDWMYAVLPIFMIWSVQMNLQKKITVGIVLSLGIFASIATIIRLKFLAELADYSDILFNGTPAMVWTLVEPGIAIAAASLITIRPLLRAMHFKGFDSTNPYTSRRTGTRTDNPNISLRNDIPMGNWSNFVSSGQPMVPANSMQRSLSRGNKVKPRIQEDAISDDGSEELILERNTTPETSAGITRTVDFKVSNDARSMRNHPEG